MFQFPSNSILKCLSQAFQLPAHSIGNDACESASDHSTDAEDGNGPWPDEQHLILRKIFRCQVIVALVHPYANQLVVTEANRSDVTGTLRVRESPISFYMEDVGEWKVVENLTSAGELTTPML